MCISLTKTKSWHAPSPPVSGLIRHLLHCYFLDPINIKGQLQTSIFMSYVHWVFANTFIRPGRIYSQKIRHKCTN